MCKICKSCDGVMNYDPYFGAEVCGRCGRMERKSTFQTLRQPRKVTVSRRTVEIIVSR